MGDPADIFPSLAAGLNRAGRGMSEAKTADLTMQPLPHQERVREKLEREDTPGQIAYHGLGTGKTFTAVNAAHKLKAPLLAVVPAALRNNMKKEIARSGFKHPYRVLSYEEARRKADDPEFREFASQAVTAYDEAHRMGRSESARSQLPDLIPSRKKLFLTGTPIRNTPEEIAPLVSALDPHALPKDPKEFRKKFIQTREVPVGFWGRLRGVKPGKVQVPVNLKHFEEAVQGKIDYHQNVNRDDFPSFSESIVEVPMSDKQQAAYHFVMGKYPHLAYKIRHGLPLSKAETKNFRSFMIGPRQVSNFPGAFNRSATDVDASKITKIVDEVQQRHDKDKNYRGVTYSSFLETGVNPLSRELSRRGIPHAVFTGEQDDKTRKKIIEDYNHGKIKHLLISGAGAEGLDLKGTKLMQITEPHWNEELIDQVRGRAIRYKSHSHLPDNERHVEVQRFHSTPQRTWLDKLMRRPKARQMAADQFLYEQAQAKRKVNEPFLRILKGEPAEQVQKDMDEYYKKYSQADFPTFEEDVFQKASAFAASLYQDGGHWCGYKVAEFTVPEHWDDRGTKLVRDFDFESYSDAEDFVHCLRKEGDKRGHDPHEVTHGEATTVQVMLQTHEPDPHVSEKDTDLARWLNDLYQRKFKRLTTEQRVRALAESVD